jgi:hypothetical protein
MASHQEKSAKPDSDHSAEDREDAGNSAPPKKSLGQKLAVVGHYLMLVLVPLVSLGALGLAGYAVMGSHSEEKQLSKSIAKVENLNAGLTASLSATKAELDKLKLAIVHDKSIQDEERKKQDERLTKVIQNITPIQMKLKIKPTLDDQFRQVAGVSSVTPVVVPRKSDEPGTKTSANEPILPSKHFATGVPVAPGAHAGVSPHPGASPQAPTNGHGKKQESQSQVLMDAIEKFNKN